MSSVTIVLLWTLIDLWGRGYSSTPTALPHDTRLYTTAISLALISSSLSWTGDNIQFSLIGYSLGGGIAMSFTSHFPSLVSSLILLAPAGLIREYHFTTTSKMMYSSGWVPESLLEWLVKRRLRGNPSNPTPTKSKATSEVEAAAGEELPDKYDPDGVVLSKNRPHVVVADAVVSLFFVAQSDRASDRRVRN